LWEVDDSVGIRLAESASKFGEQPDPLVLVRRREGFVSAVWIATRAVGVIGAGSGRGDGWHEI
jgi:hypothetical protein